MNNSGTKSKNYAIDPLLFLVKIRQLFRAFVFEPQCHSRFDFICRKIPLVVVLWARKWFIPSSFCFGDLWRNISWEVFSTKSFRNFFFIDFKSASASSWLLATQFDYSTERRWWLCEIISCSSFLKMKERKCVFRKISIFSVRQVST